MHNMAAWVVLVVFLLSSGTVTAQKGGVTFWRDKVILTCPKEGDWFKKEESKKNNSLTYEFEYNGKDRYSCVYNEDYEDEGEGVSRVYQFYVEGKACKDCFEVDASLFGMVIILDLVFTSIVIIAIYSNTKKKIPAAPSHSAPKAPARPRGRPPPGQSVEYEQLNLNTRTKDTYSVVKRT